MIVVDIETTGTDPQKHSIVSIGAIDFDKPAEQFHVECQIWNGALIDPVALSVNGFTESQVRDPSKIEEGTAIANFFNWLKTRDDILLAGQNPLFDFGFLQAGARRHNIDFRLSSRTIDLHTVTYAHMVKNGVVPASKDKRSDLNSDKIMLYVGLPTEPKPHIALNGAIWEAEALSRLLYGRNLLHQFAKFPIPF